MGVERAMVSEESLTVQLTARLREQGQWPDAVTRLSVQRIVDSVGDDALSVEVYLVDDDATGERVNELVEFGLAISLAMRELEPDPFPYVRMHVDEQARRAGVQP